MEIDMDSLTDEERSILYVQAKYCQATEDQAVFDGGNDSEEKNENSKSGSYSAYGNRSWRMWKHR